MESASPAKLDQIITDLLLALESGEPVDLDRMVRSHPEFASEIRDFFENDAKLRLTANTSDGRASVAHAPTRIGAHEILGEIARGGMGVVYKARDTKLNRIVALKMILSGNFADSGEIQRFRAEAEAAAKLEHIGIVPIHDVAQHEGFDYYTMPYVEGESLATKLQNGPLEANEAAGLVSKVARAVAYAHDCRVLHRDLKPDNILINGDGQPKITDFGVAKCLDDTRCLTGTGEIVGTLQFMSPEQAAARHEQVAETSDVYSLGAILFSTLTGCPVFRAPSQIDLLLQVLEKEPESPRRMRPSVPRELEAVCLRCLEKDPNRRYQSARELAEDLERFLADEPLRVAMGAVGTRLRRWVRRKPLLVAHVGTLLLVEILRHSKYLFSQDERQFRGEYSFIFLGWILACFAFQWLLEKAAWRPFVPYLWSAMDVLLLTLSLYLLDGPVGMLLATFALLIVVSGMFRKVRLVAFVTAVCLSGLGVLIAARPQTSPPHYAAVFAAVLLATSVVVGYQVRRLGYLSSFYEQFH